MRGDTRFLWLCRLIGGVLTLAFGLGGCAPVSGPALPEQRPTENLPTAVALTVAAGRHTQVSPDVPPTSPVFLNSSSSPTQALDSTPLPPASQTPTQAMTSTATNTPTLRWKAKTPTVTPTPPIPAANIQILSPGPGSRVVSPIKFSAYLQPGDKGNVTIELLGEDGRLLVRTIKTYYAGTRVHANLEIEYEIAAVAEAGRLQISTRDEWGRTDALASVDLLLLSIGDSDLSPPGDIQERIVIQEPQPKTLIQGKTVWISGLTRTDSSTPLFIEMYNREGKQVGPTKLVNGVPSSYDGFYAFSTEIPYSVDSPTWVRLVIFEIAGRFPGPAHLSSVEILLSP